MRGGAVDHAPGPSTRFTGTCAKYRAMASVGVEKVLKKCLINAFELLQERTY